LRRKLRAVHRLDVMRGVVVGRNLIRSINSAEYDELEHQIRLEVEEEFLRTPQRDYVSQFDVGFLFRPNSL
jgi:hypothetical protein